MAEINKDLLLSRIIHSRDLTALEKRYLEKLVEAYDPNTVKRAEWVDRGNLQGLKCSNCGRKASYHNGTRGYESYMAFCPGCGYDMRGDDNVDKTDR